MALKHKGILRIGYVRIGLPDSRLEQSAAFYTGTLGMLAGRVQPDRIYLRCWHESHEFSLVIDETQAPGLIEVGFQVRDAEDLYDVARRVEASGIGVTREGAGEPLAGLGESIHFEVPQGPRLRLFAHMAQAGYVTGFDSPDWVPPRELRGTPAPLFLNHVGFTSADPAAAVDFLTGTLGFTVSEKIVSDSGTQLLSALLFRMSKDVGGQELAIFPGSATRLHHIAFSKEDSTDILIDGQYLRQERVQIERYGPTRQSYGKTFSLHFRDPHQVRLELCSGGRVTEAHPEFEPVVWREADLGKALSYYDRDLDESFLDPCL